MEQSRPRKPPTPGSWKPGQSGNPKGRPRAGNALAEVIRTEIDPRAIVAVAVSVIRDEKSAAAVKLQAAQFLADRGYVRPEQRHELVVGTGSDEDDVDLSRLTLPELERLEQLEAERVAILAAASERAALPEAES
jgi:glycine/D-amino acid oxidase-like deaminating enzyme